LELIHSEPVPLTVTWPLPVGLPPMTACTRVHQCRSHFPDFVQVRAAEAHQDSLSFG
jgi:hypothetical protein